MLSTGLHFASESTPRLALSVAGPNKRQRGLQGIGCDQVGERSDCLGSSARMDERGRHLKQAHAKVP